MTTERFVEADNLSVAWVKAVDLIRPLPKRSAMHLIVRIADPTQEVSEIRALADQLLTRGRLQPIDTVRNTIFPAAWAQRFAEPADLGAYYRDQYPTIRRISKKNRAGTYFGRMVAYPDGDTTIDQLSDRVAKLKKQKTGSHKSSMYEMNIWKPGDLPQGMGFPCMAFLSFHLDDNRLYLTAHYRNQFLVERAYGNYLGLAQLQCYVADAVGLTAAELMIVAGHATVDTPPQVNITAIKALIEDAQPFIPTPDDDS
jgi:Thymidylate synthase